MPSENSITYYGDSSRKLSDNSAYTRLHITPLDQSLLGAIIPQSVLPVAQNISYHTIETFPEKRYGFVDLPSADAQKLKAKLNGAILKGTKIRIEKAKASNMSKPIRSEKPQEEELSTLKVPKEKQSKKRKRQDGILEGVELKDRKIKRGWTSTEEPRQRKEKKSKSIGEKSKKESKRNATKSKYSDGPELLFKVQLPPTTITTGSDETQKKKRKHKDRNNRDVIVHEFKNTTKFPTFIKGSNAAEGKRTVEFVQGEGWVDTEGNIIEPDRSSSRLRSQATDNNETRRPKVPEDTSSEEESDRSAVEEEDGHQKASTSLSNDYGKEQQQDKDRDKNTTQKKPALERPKSSSSTRSLTIQIPPSTPAPTKVHPLEALYKNMSVNMIPGEAEKNLPGFSFFSDTLVDEGNEEDARSTAIPDQMPMTPFTRQDFEYRGVRSAAPTPDTAHPHQVARFWPIQDDIEKERGIHSDEDRAGISISEPQQTRIQEDSENDAQAERTSSKDQGEDQSDFAKTFYAERRELNKSWREARKTARKEKRYRENKGQSARV